MMTKLKTNDSGNDGDIMAKLQTKMLISDTDGKKIVEVKSLKTAKMISN